MNYTGINKQYKRFNNKLEGLKNTIICIICSKKLYRQQSMIIKNNEANRTHIALIYKFNNRNDIIDDKEDFKSCSTCKTYIAKRELLFTYNDYGTIPDQISTVIQSNNYYLINKLALITMYCKTLKTTTYSYLHQNGNPKLFFKNFKNFMGSIGLIYDEDTIDAKNYSSESKIIVLDAIKWLKQNNCQYKKYLCNYEKIINYLISSNPDSLHMGAPMILSEHLKKIDILNEEKKFPSSGFLINSDLENQYIPPQITEIEAGIAIKRQKMNTEKNNDDSFKIDIKYSDTDYEALTYVHLYPYGTGHWFYRKNGMTLNVFGKMRLLHVDSRWRDDKYYIFNILDRLTQSRLLTVNNMLLASTTIRNSVDAGQLKDKNYENYYKYGNHIPKSITGSKNYWKGKYLDLLAIISSLGFPSLFLTSTANDSWPGLKNILSVYENTCPIFHPVDVSEYFFQKFFLIMKEIKNGLLGEYTHSWYRVELQNRGAIHIHLLLWVKVQQTLIHSNLVWATTHENTEVTAKVRKYQMHTCQSPRCFKYGKRMFTKCKYGFPFDLCDENYLDEENNLHKYKRINEEDRRIVPYHPTLLLFWDGHMNIQYVTKKGIEQYLVKYISKVEPSQYVNYKPNNTVKQFLELRVISALEAAALICGHHFVQSNIQVKYITTSINGDNFKYLKTKREVANMNAESNNYFKDSTYDYYMIRPDELENINYIDYFKDYEVILKSSKRKLPIKAKKYADKKSN